MTVNKENSTFNVPNTMTICRIVLVPLFVTLLFRNEFGMALVVFAIAGISDGLDGFVARYFNQETTLGAHLDPVADKLLIVSAFACLSILHVFPRWFAMVTIFREILIVVGVLVLITIGMPYEINPSFLSKCNTMIQVITVFESLLILAKPKLDILHCFLCWATITFTLLSGLQYIRTWFYIMYGFENNFDIDR